MLPSPVCFTVEIVGVGPQAIQEGVFSPKVVLWLQVLVDLLCNAPGFTLCPRIEGHGRAVLGRPRNASGSPREPGQVLPASIRKRCLRTKRPEARRDLARRHLVALDRKSVGKGKRVSVGV